MVFLFSGYHRLPRCPPYGKSCHLVAQRLFERFDGFSLGQEIIDVVQNVHFGIATQPIHDVC